MAKKIVNLFVGSIGAKFTEWQKALATVKDLEKDSEDIERALGTDDPNNTSEGAYGAANASELAVVYAGGDRYDDKKEAKQEGANDIAMLNFHEKLDVIINDIGTPRTPLEEALYNAAMVCDNFLLDTNDSSDSSSSSEGNTYNFIVSKNWYYDFACGVVSFEDAFIHAYGGQVPMPEDPTEEDYEALLSDLKKNFITDKQIYEKALNDFENAYSVITTYFNAYKVQIDVPAEAGYTYTKGIIKLSDIINAYKLYKRGFENLNKAYDVRRSAYVNLNNALELKVAIAIELEESRIKSDALEEEFKIVCPTYFDHSSNTTFNLRIGAINKETERIFKDLDKINKETQDIINDVDKSYSTSVKEVSDKMVALAEKATMTNNLGSELQYTISTSTKISKEDKEKLTEEINTLMQFIEATYDDVEKCIANKNYILHPDLALIEIKTLNETLDKELNGEYDETGALVAPGILTISKEYDEAVKKADE